MIRPGGGVTTRCAEVLGRKQLDPGSLEQKREAWRKQGLSLATLNGSFDLMHAGHLHIIYEASLQADILCVALNSDSSIQQYKGAERPIIPLRYRMQMMAALEFVDYVTWFDETDPLQILEVLQPDVHVNGAEYGADCLEASLVRKHGGRVHIVDLVPGLSTSEIIAKINSICD